MEINVQQTSIAMKIKNNHSTLQGLENNKSQKMIEDVTFSFIQDHKGFSLSSLFKRGFT